MPAMIAATIVKKTNYEWTYGFPNAALGSNEY